MTDTVIAAIVGVGGAVVVAITGALVQVSITRSVIQAERRKIREHLLGEAALRRADKVHDQLLDALADLLAAADPQIGKGGDYDRTVRLIHRVQLLLDRENELERGLFSAVNALGLKLQEYVAVRHLDIEHKSLETRALLGAQGAVLEAAKPVLKQHAT